MKSILTKYLKIKIFKKMSASNSIDDLLSYKEEMKKHINVNNILI